MSNITINKNNSPQPNLLPVKPIESKLLQEKTEEVKTQLDLIQTLQEFISDKMESVKEERKRVQEECLVLYNKAKDEMDNMLAKVVQIDSDDDEIKTSLDRIKVWMQELANKSNEPSYIAGHDGFAKKILACLSYRQSFLDTLESDYIVTMVDLQSSGVTINEETMYQRIAESYESRIKDIIEK